MPNTDLILPDTSELPALVKNIPRSEDDKRQLLALIQAKSSQMRDCTRLLRQEKFKANEAKAKQQAVIELPVATNSGPAPVPSADLEEAIDQQYGSLREKLQAAGTSSDVVDFVQHLQTNSASWSQEMRAKLEQIFEVVRQQSELPEDLDDRSWSTSNEEELQAARARLEALNAEISQVSREKSLSSVSTEAHDAESTTASRDTSLGRDAQNDQLSAPSSARSCSDAGRQPAAVETTAQPEPEMPAEEKPAAPAKGKGKGKGKGPGKAPPPPKVAAAPTNNGLNSFLWQVTKNGDNLQETSQELRNTLQAKRETSCTGAAPQELRNRPVFPGTVFSDLPEDEMPSFPQHTEHWLKKRDVARTRITLDAKTVADDEPQGFLDEKTIELLGITLKRHQHQNKARLADIALADALGAKGLEVILDIKSAILRCSYDAVCIELLSVIRTVVRQQDMVGRPVEAFMNEVGPEEFQRRLKSPLEHRLVSELCKVPQIAERLECMIFHTSFNDHLGKYSEALGVHRTALEMLSRKRETIRRFFLTALKLGQSLNRQSKKASKAANGFSLASLEQLSQTKSTKLPRMSFMHFVIALMRPEDADALFDVEDVALLQKAAVLRTHKVFNDCVETAQGLDGVQEICRSGQYICPETGNAVTIERMARHRLQSSPHPAGESADDSAIDDDDHFHQVMEHFVEANRDAAEDLGESAFNLIVMYKELAIYFDDMHSVYPPPKSEKDTRRDLVEVFHKFAVQIQQHREQVEQEKLRERLSTSSRDLSSKLSLPSSFLRRRAETSPDLSPASGESPPPSRSGEDTTSSLSGTCYFELQRTPEARGFAADEEAVQQSVSEQYGLADVMAEQSFLSDQPHK